MQRTKTLLILAGLLLLMADPAYASSDAHPLPWKNFLFRIGNIVLFCGVIWYFFGGKIKGFFANRTSSIAEEISSLEQQKATAQQQLTDIGQRISALDAERDKILAAYHTQGETLKKEIITQAQKAAQQITEQAKNTAQNEVANAISGLREQMANEIITAAEKSLAKRMTPEEQAKLVDKYLTRVVLN